MTPEQLKETYLLGDFKLKSEFNSGGSNREAVLTRAERYAGWTLPIIMPTEDSFDSEEMQNDYQSVGAQAVTNLANKILMALFQPSKPFFRAQLTKELKNTVRSTTGMTDPQIDSALAQAERDAMKEFEKNSSRVVLNDTVQHLIVTGNALLFSAPDEKTVMYSLRDFTIKRNLRGEFVKIIIKETKDVAGLSDELAALAKTQGYSETDDVSLYSCILRTGVDKFIVWQEMEDICYCHKQLGVYGIDTLPWIPLAWNIARGNDYGTGLVENYSGDFHTLSTLAEAGLDYTVIMTDVKILVNPTGMTDVTTIAEAKSGAYVHGKEEDLFVHTANVANATDFLDKKFDTTARRIGAAFLLTSQVTRDAERVTAEEIRMQAQELESSLGGVYSRLAAELQLPLAKRLLRRLDPIFKNVEPVIVTGFESLSRNSELSDLRAFFTDLGALADLPDEIKARLKFGEVIAVLGAGHGVDYDKWLKDEATVKKEQEALAKAEAAQAGMEAGAVDQATQSTN